jgi:hypothetical protein
MSSYHLVNKETGIVMAGYVVKSAQPEEIAIANRRLSDSLSSWKFLEELNDAPAASAIAIP